ncbi:MAG: CRISPR-associated endonuclease Cas2 [Epsilonproteobacteria bacterium]|nr:CRISPR-associated endonuclease Cas2 [Campylobacterota bacterium]
MKRDDYLVCYDIANSKRLNKLARYLEKRTIRIQYSIFVAKNFTKEQIYQIAQDIVDIIDPDEDDVRIYRIIDNRLAMGSAYDLDDVFLFV